MDPTQDPQSQATKPGWQTSEAWAALVAVLVPALGKLSVWPLVCTKFWPTGV